jgi:hypothetical protein
LVEGSSIYLRQGEKLTIRQLLYGLMLRSGNDCAVALAVKIGGNVERFAEMMNELARKIGVEKTNFVNPHGLHDDNHYTTAFDLARISAYAMKNSVFREIVSTKNITISGVEGERVLVNKNKMLSTFAGGDGIKTGFTKRAGRCLVSSAIKNGMEVVSVVLNCIVGSVYMIFVTLLAILIDMEGGGPELYYQIFYFIPAFSVLCISASVALRRKGYRISSLVTGLGGPVIFALYLVVFYVGGVM